MKRLWYFCALIAALGTSSCKTSPMKKQCGPCPLVAEIEPSVDVKILSKTGDTDLFLSPTSPYSLAQLKMTSSINGNNVGYYADTTNAGNRNLRIFCSASQTITLKLASLSADSIRIVAKNDSPVCCPTLTLKAVWLNNNLVCSPCMVSQPVTIYK